MTSLTKYNADAHIGVVDNKKSLDPDDDVAHIRWGGTWRIPSIDEMKELISKCTWEWTTLNGEKGYKVISKKNGNSIFLPAAGYRRDSDLRYAGSDGYYWLSSLNWFFPNDDAYGLYFDSSDVLWDYYAGRSYGRSVRAVCE